MLAWSITVRRHSPGSIQHGGVRLTGIAHQSCTASHILYIPPQSQGKGVQMSILFRFDTRGTPIHSICSSVDLQLLSSQSCPVPTGAHLRASVSNFFKMAMSTAARGWCEFCCKWVDEDGHRRRDCPLFTEKDRQDGRVNGGE